MAVKLEARKSPSRHKVSFIATKKVRVPTRVSFSTKTGRRVTFAAKKTATKRVRVTFYKRSKK